MSKIKKPKQENMKNYFYYLNKNTKFELFEPPVDSEHETIEKIKKFYILESSPDQFIDEIIFCRLDNISIYSIIFRHFRRFLVEKDI